MYPLISDFTYVMAAANIHPPQLDPCSVSTQSMDQKQDHLVRDGLVQIHEHLVRDVLEKMRLNQEQERLDQERNSSLFLKKVVDYAFGVADEDEYPYKEPELANSMLFSGRSFQSDNEPCYGASRRSRRGTCPCCGEDFDPRADKW